GVLKLQDQAHLVDEEQPIAPSDVHAEAERSADGHHSKPNNRNATKTDSNVNVVRTLRRHTFLQIRGRNFMADHLPSVRLYRDGEYDPRGRLHAGRASP